MQIKYYYYLHDLSRCWVQMKVCRVNSVSFLNVGNWVNGETGDFDIAKCWRIYRGRWISELLLHTRGWSFLCSSYRRAIISLLFIQRLCDDAAASAGCCCRSCIRFLRSTSIYHRPVCTADRCWKRECIYKLVRYGCYFCQSIHIMFPIAHEVHV